MPIFVNSSGSLRTYRLFNRAVFSIEERSETVGFVRGDIYFINDSRLHIRELIDIQKGERIKYAYHYQAADGAIIFRYDNAPHLPSLANFPHHKHLSTSSAIISSEIPTLSTVLNEIESLIE